MSGLRTGYTVTTRTSATTGAVANATFSTTPTPDISGTAKVGETLTADAGTWKPTPTKLTYQWLRDGKTISGATKSTYTVQVADSKAKLSVVTTATRTARHRQQDLGRHSRGHRRHPVRTCRRSAAR